jgi:hypothetical protein
LRDDRGQCRFSFELFPLGVEDLQAQAIIRRLLSELRPDSGEELNGLKGNTQDIVRTQVQSTAALQRPTISEKDYLHWRRGLVAFELSEKTTTVECSYIRLQQDQIRLMLKNCTHIRAFRCGNVVSSAREFRHEPRAQIVGGAKQENLWHASFSHASNLQLNLLADGLIGIRNLPLLLFGSRAGLRLGNQMDALPSARPDRSGW